MLDEANNFLGLIFQTHLSKTFLKCLYSIDRAVSIEVGDGYCQTHESPESKQGTK
jgi:hypothetical protein